MIAADQGIAIEEKEDDYEFPCIELSSKRLATDAVPKKEKSLSSISDAETIKVKIEEIVKPNFGKLEGNVLKGDNDLPNCSGDRIIEIINPNINGKDNANKEGISNAKNYCETKEKVTEVTEQQRVTQEIQEIVPVRLPNKFSVPDSVQEERRKKEKKSMCLCGCN